LSRKNPSSHNHDQFALFVEKMRSGSEKIDQARFSEMVRGLIRVDSEATQTASVESKITNPAANANGREMQRPMSSTPGSAAAPPDFLPLIGQLFVQWSNNQSLLIRLLALMLETDGPSAAAIFSTLCTTQLRLDLLRRLALLKVGDRQTLHEINKIIDDFDDACRRRDELIHAFGESQAIGQHRVADVVVACDNLRLIGRALDDLMPKMMHRIETHELQAAAD
jgi:hypothetical protein